VADQGGRRRRGAWRPGAGALGLRRQKAAGRGGGGGGAADAGGADAITVYMLGHARGPVEALFEAALALGGSTKRNRKT